MEIPPIRNDKLVNQVTVKSAVNPILWIIAVISLPLFFLSSQTEGWFSIAAFVVAFLLIILFVYSYLFLLHKNPEYLRSEDFQLRMNTMRYMGDKDNPNVGEDSSIVEMESLENPRLTKPKVIQQQIK